MGNTASTATVTGVVPAAAVSGTAHQSRPVPARGPGTALGRVHSLAETGSDSSVCIFQAPRNKGQMAVAPALGQDDHRREGFSGRSIQEGPFQGSGVEGGGALFCLVAFFFLTILKDY